MKKLFFASLTLLFALSFNAQAQSTTGTVNLSVTLKPIQTLLVTANQKDVDLLYDNTTAYSAGVTASMADHLTLYSTGGFTVTVNSTAANLDQPSGYTGASNILANSISIAPTAGTVNPLGNTPTYSTVLLGLTPGTIIDSNLGGVGQKVNIAYAGAGGDAYINNHVNGVNPSVYKTVVTYTIAPK